MPEGTRLGAYLGPHSSTGSARAAMPWPKVWQMNFTQTGGVHQTSASVYKDVFSSKRAWDVRWEFLTEANRNTLRAEWERTTSLDWTPPDTGSASYYEVLSVDPWREENAVTVVAGSYRYHVNMRFQER
jgi:hypothetical protein